MLKLLSQIHLKLNPYRGSLTLKRLDQENFIFQLESKIPENDEISLLKKKYRCHKNVCFYHKWLVYNLLSVPFLIGSIPYLILKALFFRKKSTPIPTVHFSKIIPIETVDTTSAFVPKSHSLSLAELMFIFKNTGWGALLHPYFSVRVLWKSARYLDAIYRFAPQKIYCSEEMNFESPITTLICRHHKVKHLNVMHGEKLYFIKDAYISFDQFYVWEQSFADLFSELNAFVDEFKFFNPIPADLKITSPSEPIFKYYAQYSESFEEFKLRVQNCLNYTKNNKLSLVYRPHPRHIESRELSYLKDNGVLIEKNSKSIYESILESQEICAEWSSVLFQAKHLNRQLVLDNTNKGNMAKLVELGFVILKDKNLKYLTEQ